ncbi:DUF4879 domain-containing protein [Dyella sp. 333MFSha]|uniref:DUF4879 domain-containing protein n=1 Tax=Dyella sp. 333MFSha TaxID=1798240 RepID=UPI000B8357FC|nr:DUF4879 domain-containing protein [Dyella sp. 333MFSha]
MKADVLAAAAFFMLSTQAFAQGNNLSRAFVSSVTSSKGGFEDTSGRSSTTRDHGGTSMLIRTDDIGYGKHAQARLLGSPLREVQTHALCKVNGRTALCNGRGTVIGYRRTWEASGREGGNFEYMVIPNGVGAPVRVSFQIR